MAARRGKSQARRGGGSSRRVPGWIWLLAGLLLGLALSVFVLMREGGSDRVLPRPNPQAQAPRESEPAPAVTKPATPTPPPAEEKPRKPRYDFYTVLPGKEVLVPDSELAQKARDEAAQPPAAATAPTERYVLQAGAFRDNRDAEALKARVALTGLVARVETAQIDNRPIYRVRLGPYPTARELESAKQQLANNGITQTIAVREPASAP